MILNLLKNFDGRVAFATRRFWSGLQRNIASASYPTPAQHHKEKDLYPSAMMSKSNFSPACLYNPRLGGLSGLGPFEGVLRKALARFGQILGDKRDEWSLNFGYADLEDMV